jgi:hypothetical protein
MTSYAALAYCALRLANVVNCRPSIESAPAARTHTSIDVMVRETTRRQAHQRLHLLTRRVITHDRRRHSRHNHRQDQLLLPRQRHATPLSESV